MTGHWGLLVLFLALGAQRSFVETAPLHEEIPTALKNSGLLEDETVQQLETLKHPFDNSLRITNSKSSIYTNVDGKEHSTADLLKQVTTNGRLVSDLEQHIESESSRAGSKPITDIKTSIEIPSRGIHSTYEKTVDPETKTSAFGSPARYTPMDMAEYIFWTGDEKGVTLAIEEFLQEGIMARADALSFLQEIKNDLDFLKERYTKLGLNSEKVSKPKTVSLQPIVKSTNQLPSSFHAPIDFNSYDREKQKKNTNRDLVKDEVLSTSGIIDASTEDYDELLERLRMADFLYTEYSLEEVIYQLAKVMFSQSLTRGNNEEAQQALQKFTRFLETETEQGRISQALEKKVLDVLIAALSDTLGEHPEVLVRAGEGKEHNFLRQILDPGSGEGSGVDRTSYYLGADGRREGLNLGRHVPIQMEKMKGR